MEGNPYVSLVNTIRNDNKYNFPANYRLGTVVSALPLTVDVAGNVQEENDLLKSDTIVNFAKGEQLLLIPVDDEQKYIIICKVVNV